MSFLYPRLITISREVRDSTPGEQGYGGTNISTQSIITSNLSAHIQTDRQGGMPGAKLAADASGQSVWKIIFKGAAGLVQDRDFITDDIGRTFQVISADPNPMVTTCRCQIMET